MQVVVVLEEGRGVVEGVVVAVAGVAEVVGAVEVVRVVLVGEGVVVGSRVLARMGGLGDLCWILGRSILGEASYCNLYKVQRCSVRASGCRRDRSRGRGWIRCRLGGGVA